MVTASGEPIGNFRISETVGPNGSAVLHDHILFNTLGHLNRNRIPERFAHAKGAGAHGYFEVTHDITRYCGANLFSDIGKRTPVFVRFSTVAGDAGTADTRQEHRGFAIKFYTEEGNWDLVGNTTPVFALMDAMSCGSFFAASRRHQQTNLRDPNMTWDHFSYRPDSAHQVLMGQSDRGLSDGYRHLHGFGVNTFRVINNDGESFFCKFTWRTNQGIRTLTAAQARALQGSDPQYSTRDLFNNIEQGNFPSWTFYIQIMTVDQADNWRLNPFDSTKVWPHREFPLIEVGQLVLNRNPSNFFDEVEQVALSPANFVPGIRASPDRVLATRMFAYSDAQRYRLGVNHEQLPINAPLKPPRNYLRRGAMNFLSQGAAVTYFPNSMGGPIESERARRLEGSYKACGEVKRHNPIVDPYEQPRELFERVMDDGERRRTVINICSTLRNTQPFIQRRTIAVWAKVSQDLADMIEEELRRNPPPPTK